MSDTNTENNNSVKSDKNTDNSTSVLNNEQKQESASVSEDISNSKEHEQEQEHEHAASTDDKKHSGKAIDNLYEDPVISNQLWCCISFISPELVKNCNFRAVKVRGVYGTKEEATKRAAFLQKIDPDFHIFVGEVGKWLGWDPDPNSIEDQQYSEKKLQKLMTGYKKNRDKARIMEEERKREMLEENVRREAEKVKSTTQTKGEKRIERMKKTAEEHKMDKKMKEIEDNRFKPTVSNNSSTSTVADSDVVTKERERLLKKEEQIMKSTEQLSTTDEKLNYLQKLYSQLQDSKKVESK